VLADDLLPSFDPGARPAPSPRSRRSEVRRRLGATASIVVGLLGLRVAYLFADYVRGGSTQRFHVESAATLFVLAGLSLALVRRPRGPAEPRAPARFPIWLAPAFCGAALTLYWPALPVGFLSDDFGLAARASAWSAGAIGHAFFRPVPLLIWALLLHLGAGAMPLHVLNVLLHGANAYLTVRVVAGWIPSRAGAVLAGLIVLTSPLAPEAVVWCSGIFDVLMTTLILAAILTARAYDPAPAPAARLLFFTAIAGALLTKETGAVAPALVALDVWTRDARSRRLFIDLVIAAAVVTMVSLARLTSAFGLTVPAVTRYVIQRAVFGSVGGLAVPWHIDVIRATPWLPFTSGLLVTGLFLAFFLQARRSPETRTAIAGAAWLLIAVAPVGTIFFISPDLQASRYLYLPAVGWATLVGAVATRTPGPGHRAARAVLACAAGLVVLGVVGTRLHLQPWRDAAALRDDVERAARSDAAMRACGTVTLGGLPDSVRGAYVFRNGAPEAFLRDLGLRAAVSDDPGPCAFRWDPDTHAFTPRSRTLAPER
jgi:hypothetical protein